MLFQVLFFFPLILFINVHAIDDADKDEIVSLTSIEGEIKVGKTLKIEMIIPVKEAVVLIALQEGTEDDGKGNLVFMGIQKTSTSEKVHFFIVEDSAPKGFREYINDPPAIDETGQVEIKIKIITAEKYEISLNDKPYEYPVKVPIEKLTHLKIGNNGEGLVKVENIEWLTDGEKDC